MFFKRKPKAPPGPVYQFYANVNPNTCPPCLLRHGEVFSDPRAVPPLHEGCRCAALPVEAEALKDAQQQGARMQEKAQAELRRRRLLETALTLFDQDRDEALVCLRESVAIDVHLEELEAFRCRCRGALEADAALMARLRKLFVTAYFQKMDQPKYKWISPGLYGQLETQGRKRIQALFADPVPR